MKWRTDALDSIAILDRQSIHPSEADPETPYLGLEHLDGEGAINRTQTVASAGLKSNKFQFSERHLLFGKLRPYLRKIVKPDFSGVCSTDIIPILPKNRVSRDYLFYFLRTPETVSLATSRCSGVNLPRLSPKQLAAFQIPLPPLAEQKRIAGILDAAGALRAKRREALAQLDTLLQSTFFDMFGDPVTNPMGWEERSLGELAQTGFRNGISPSAKGTFDGEVLTLSAITRGRFDFAARKDAHFDKQPSLSQKLNIDTFLICRGNGNRKLVGTGTYPDRSSNRVCFPDTMIGVTIDPAALTAAYLQRVWRTHGVRRQIERGARTTNGTHKVNQRLLPPSCSPFRPRIFSFTSPPSWNLSRNSRPFSRPTSPNSTTSSLPCNPAPSGETSERPWRSPPTSRS